MAIPNIQSVYLVGTGVQHLIDKLKIEGSSFATWREKNCRKKVWSCNDDKKLFLDPFLAGKKNNEKKENSLTQPGNNDSREALTTIQLLLRYLVLQNKRKKVLWDKVAELNRLVQGG